MKMTITRTNTSSERLKSLGHVSLLGQTTVTTPIQGKGVTFRSENVKAKTGRKFSFNRGVSVRFRADEHQHPIRLGITTPTVQVFRHERLRKIDSFLNSMALQAENAEFPNAKVVVNARRIWRDVQSRFGDLLQEPLASLGADGGILFTWKRISHYLEIEVKPEEIEVFYENESTEDVQYSSYRDYSLDIIKYASSFLLRMIV